jgi:YVTN family beta-propeller protein
MSFGAKSGALIASIFSFALVFSGCGESFRPVANPVFPPGGDPQRSRHALVISSNGNNPGSAVVIDVSGDTYAAIFSGNNGVGRNPVYATNRGGTDYVINHNDNSVSSFILPVVPNSLNPPSLISLPEPSTNPACGGAPAPSFAAVAQGKVFVAESGSNCVAVIDASTNGVTLELAVNGSPLGLVATPDGTKLYVLQADNTISVFLVATNEKIATIPLSAAPVWGTGSSDSTRVFVVKSDNTVSVIDTTPGGKTDTEINVLEVGAGANYMVYDPALNRAYVTNTSGNSLSIIQNATAVPPAQATVLATVSLASPPSPCNGQHPVSVTALANGSKVYVADQGTNSVCVLNTSSNTFVKSICVGTAPIFIASDSDSFRVYTANSGSFDVSVIQTADDTPVMVPGNPATPLTFCAGPPNVGVNGSVACLPGFVPKYIAMTP